MCTLLEYMEQNPGTLSWRYVKNLLIERGLPVTVEVNEENFFRGRLLTGLETQSSKDYVVQWEDATRIWIRFYEVDPAADDLAEELKGLFASLGAEELPEPAGSGCLTFSVSLHALA